MPHWGAGQVLLLNRWSRCMTSCASMCWMPGKVHADDIPVPVQSRAAVKPGQPGCGSTSVMTVTPVHRCPGGLVSRTVRTGKVSIHKITGRFTAGALQADAYGGYRALYESGRITEAACGGSCPEKNPRCACKSAHLHHHGSPAAYR